MDKPRHPDFKTLEASRPPFDAAKTPSYSQAPSPSWRFGSGPNALLTPSASSAPHAVISPSPALPPGALYKFLISAVVPRPIALVSSASRDRSVLNLAPFSYFNLVSHDPPLFAVGFTGSLAHPKDSLRNVLDAREAVINIISEHYAEAANATCVNAPYGADEWPVSGLTPGWDTHVVKAPRVKEAIVSIEVKVVSANEYESRLKPGTMTAVVVVFEGVRFWVREDALTDEGIVDPAVLRPISRLGGITYGRSTELFELLRPQFDKDLGGQEGYDSLKKPPN